MYHKDYLIRLIQMFSRTLSRIVGFKQARMFEQAQAEIQKATQQYLAVDHRLVEVSSEQTLITLLKAGGELNRPKCLMLADLLKEQGELYELQQEAEKSRLSYRKALSLMLEAFLTAPERIIAEEQAKVTLLGDKLAAEPLPDQLAQKLVRYYEAIAHQTPSAAEPKISQQSP